MNTWIP